MCQPPSGELAWIMRCEVVYTRWSERAAEPMTAARFNRNRKLRAPSLSSSRLGLCRVEAQWRWRAVARLSGLAKGRIFGGWTRDHRPRREVVVFPPIRTLSYYPNYAESGGGGTRGIPPQSWLCRYFSFDFRVIAATVGSNDDKR